MPYCQCPICGELYPYPEPEEDPGMCLECLEKWRTNKISECLVCGVAFTDEELHLAELCPECSESWQDRLDE